MLKFYIFYLSKYIEKKYFVDKLFGFLNVYFNFLFPTSQILSPSNIIDNLDAPQLTYLVN